MDGADGVLMPNRNRLSPTQFLAPTQRREGRERLSLSINTSSNGELWGRRAHQLGEVGYVAQQEHFLALDAHCTPPSPRGR